MPLPSSPPAGKKPKSLSRWLWLFSAFYIVYGTALPFRFGLDPEFLRARLAAVDWYPLFPSVHSGVSALGDYVQNILLFLPFGFLGYVAISDKRACWKPPAVAAMGCALSAAVEGLQIFSETRFPALTDLGFNALGTALGVAAGIRLRKSLRTLGARPGLRRFLDAESAYPALLFGLLVVAGAWEPFNFSLEFGTLGAKLQETWNRPFSLALSPDDFLTFSRFACFALFACRWFGETGVRGGKWAGAGWALALGLGLEAMQFIIESRMPQFQDALVIAFAMALGLSASFLPVFRTHSRASGAVLVGAFALAIVLKDLFPYRFGPFSGGFNFIPFLPYARHVSFAALADFSQEATAYFSLGFVASRFSSGRRGALRLSLPIAVALSVAVEALQRGLAGRNADATEILGAVLGVLAGNWAVTEGRRLYAEYTQPPGRNEGD